MLICPRALPSMARAALLILVFASISAAQGPGGSRQFEIGSPYVLEELPAGRFERSLRDLPPQARARALGWLRSFHFTELDVGSLHVDETGAICYACAFPLPPPGAMPEAEAEPEFSGSAVPIDPFPEHLIFHSNPGAPNVLYLNFVGETVTGTAWNNLVDRSEIPARPFSTDSDITTFSSSEQTAIRRIWQRVAEDFAPFNINVTTERPATFNNRTAVALITRNTDLNGDPNPLSNAGGVAYVNVFGTSNFGFYRPAWVYHNNVANNESYIAEVVSHEIGHNLGLSHDGTTAGAEYYTGHGSGETSWGPIMGAAYNRNVTQWCKGDYYLANNLQDDLAVIAGKISYRTDDHGNTRGTATPLVITDGTQIVSTTPQNDPDNLFPANKGILGRTGDVDVFSFITGTGPISLSVQPWVMPSGTRGGNLDILIELYNEAGDLLLWDNPASQTGASLQAELEEGRYYLYVRNTSVGDPFSSSPTGYTVYGSLGQYFISGTITEAFEFNPAPIAEAQVADLVTGGLSTHEVLVTYTDDTAIDVSSIGTGNIRVTGPNGYDEPGAFTALDQSGNGTPRTATYALPPPDGEGWRPSDNGLYTVFMEPEQVRDTQGAYVAPGELATFTVGIPTAIYIANMDEDPGWTLEPDWQYGTPSYGSGGPTAGVTGTKIVGYNLSGNYPNNLSERHATTPPINTVGNTSLTLRFHRWLGLRNGDTARIQVSTNGTDWIQVWSTSSAVSDGAWQLVQYPLPASVAGAPALQLRWSLSSVGRGNSPTAIGWNIDDVFLLGDGAVDADPPDATLSVADLTVAGAPSHACSVTYTDETAVLLASLDSTNLLVSGPNGYTNFAEFVGADLPDDGSPITASYAIPAPQEAWSADDNGVYIVTLQEGAVEDTLGNVTPETVLGSFEVAISTVGPGVLSVTPESPFETAGFEGGPFDPASVVYTLTNVGESPLTWAVSVDADWLDLSAAEGSLPPDDFTSVTVSVNALANDFVPGDYEATISLLNTGSGEGSTSRAVVLSVDPAPLVELAVTVNNPAWGSVTPSNGLYPIGTTTTLTAQAETWYAFDGWNGDVESDENSLTLTLNENTELRADFSEILTEAFPTPYWWLAEYGYTENQEEVVTSIGANGHALWESYIAGLNPNDPDSRLETLAEVAPEIGSFVITWSTVEGRLYTLHVSAFPFDVVEPLPDAVRLPWTTTSYTNQLDGSLGAAFFGISVEMAD